MDILCSASWDRRRSKVPRSDAWVLELQSEEVELLEDPVVFCVPHAGADLFSWRHQSESLVMLLGMLPQLRHVERVDHLLQSVVVGDGVFLVHVTKNAVQMPVDSLV